MLLEPRQQYVPKFFNHQFPNSGSALERPELTSTPVFENSFLNAIKCSSELVVTTWGHVLYRIENYTVSYTLQLKSQCWAFCPTKLVLYVFLVTVALNLLPLLSAKFHLLKRLFLTQCYHSLDTLKRLDRVRTKA